MWTGSSATSFVARPHCFATSRPIFVMELAPYVLEERGASLDQLLSYFIPNGYLFYDERTQKRLPSTAKELQRLVASGESMNVIARVS